jgi:hypothetical protein
MEVKIAHGDMRSFGAKNSETGRSQQVAGNYKTLDTAKSRERFIKFPKKSLYYMNLKL